MAELKKNGIEIDLSRVKTKYFIEWAMNPENTLLMLQVLDQAVIGGASDRPITELPAVIAKFMMAMSEYQTEITLATSSMRLHLLGGKDD